MPLTWLQKSRCHFCNVLVTTQSVLFSVGGNDPRGDLQESKVIGPVLEAGHHHGPQQKSDIVASYWLWIFRFPHLSKKTNIDFNKPN